jgi:predicted dehydrogenase
MKLLNEITAAVVGTGFIGAVHIDAIRRLGVNVAGLVGSSADRAKDKVRQLGVRRAYSSYDEMLADDSVDVVHITSPNDEHPAQAEAALKAGKHVICEKPLALTSTESDRLRKIARDTGLVAAVNFNIRFYPQVQEMRSRVRSGGIGSPFLIAGSYLQDWLLYDSDWNWRVEAKRGGNLRVVGDIGSHWFDLATFVTGQRIVEVLADLPTFVPVRKRPVGPVETFGSGGSDVTTNVAISSEDAALILLRFADGGRGALVASQVSAGHKNGITMEINGARSSLSWKGERPDELWIGHRSKPNELLMRDPSLLSPDVRPVATLPGGHGEGFENSFKAMYRAVYVDIVAGRPSNEPVYATFEDGHEEALIVEAVADSARTGQWTAIERA